MNILESLVIALLEDRISFLKDKNKDKLDTSHEISPEFREMNSDQVIDHLSSVDPSKNKQYTQWLTHQYKNKAFKLEDAGEVGDALRTFHENKPKLEKKDINQYKNPSELHSALGAFHTNQEEKHQELLGSLKDYGAKEIYNSGGTVVHHLATKESAIAARNFAGKDCKWCTGRNDSSNMFSSYNGRGKLYHVSTPDKKQWQFHFETNQFADPSDTMHDPYILSSKYPDLQKSFEDKHPAFMSDERAREILKSPSKASSADYAGAVRKPFLTREQLESAHNDKDDDVRRSSYRSLSMTHDDISKALNDENSYVRKVAISHPNATSEHISKALNDEDIDVRYAAIKHPNATSEHISKTLNDEYWGVRSAAISHPNATSEHISKALNDKDWSVRESAIGHPNATPEHISKALNDKDWGVRRAAIEHPDVTSEHISKALNDEYDNVRYAAIQHPNATPEHISKALNDEDRYVRRAAIQHPKATSEHISKALNDENLDVRKAAIQHPKATSEHITKALNDENLDVRSLAKSKFGELKSSNA